MHTLSGIPTRTMLDIFACPLDGMIFAAGAVFKKNQLIGE
jgi:hypothetical protein